jgi:hypothetical protein
LKRIESLTRFDQASACDLEQVLLVLPAMQEPASKGFGQPQVRTDDLVNDLLTPGRTRSLSFEKEVLSTLGEFFPGGLRAIRNERGVGDSHQRDTLRVELRAWRASRPHHDATTLNSSMTMPWTIQKAKKSLRKDCCSRSKYQVARLAISMERNGFTGPK